MKNNADPFINEIAKGFYIRQMQKFDLNPIERENLILLSNNFAVISELEPGLVIHETMSTMQ
jgi:hypothetical protein